MDKKKNEPKDLGVKIGTPEEAFWTGIKSKCETAIKDAGHEIEINEKIRVFAESKIKAEEAK